MNTKQRPGSVRKSLPVARTKAAGPRAAMAGDPVAADQVAALKIDDMPWFSKEGLAALADVPEVSGPATYKKLAD